ncbi:hypothetical protein LCGC14_2465360 [marine sediment metagenome]|uniref:Uncharacterized protein n=1 Tax=marine sediment metagenome TaxID=412755 RepID=A0A0F9BZR4_9ZZZZ
MDRFDYIRWPRTDDGMILFKSTSEAFYYAANIFTNEPMFQEIQLSHRKCIARFESLRPLTEDNLQAFLEVSYKIQFFRECIEEVTRIRKVLKYNVH